VNMDGGDVLASRIVDLVSNVALSVVMMFLHCRNLVPILITPCIKRVALIMSLHHEGVYINNFTVLDPEINFSDHLPLLIDVTIKCTSPTCSGTGSSRDYRTSNTLSANQNQLRWDKADRSSYSLVSC